MTQDTVVIYHGDQCHDGFGAAYVAWTQLGDRALYHPVLYGANEASRWPDVRGKDVLVLDYALPYAVYERLKAEARTLQQLDHHGTAQQLYQKHGCTDPNCRFDLDHSGAMMAWQHFHGDTPPPLFLQHIEDYDLWRFRLEATVPFGRGARTRPMTFEAWDRFQETTTYASIVRDGRLLEAQWGHWMHQLAQEAVPVTLHGQPGLVVQANGAYRSEVGALLARASGTYGMVWHGRADGSMACSLRSIDVPCRPLVEQLGGGGHPNAGGFRRDSLAEVHALLGATWSTQPMPHWQAPRAPATPETQALAVLAEVEAWQVQDAHRVIRVDGRPVGDWPALTTAVERQAAGQLLVAQRDQVVTSVLADALITTLDEAGHTAAWVLTDATLEREVAEALLAQGHVAVQTVRITADGAVAQAHGTPEWVQHAWPDTQGLPETVPSARRRLKC